MTYDINTSLERLEKNLLEVDSARKQLEKIIATSNSLQEIIGKYTGSLDVLSKDVSLLISEVQRYQNILTSDLRAEIDRIKESCDGVIAQFNFDLKTSTDFFESKFTDTISMYKSENSKLTEQVNKLATLQDSFIKVSNIVNDVDKKINILSKTLQESQEEQNKAITNIKTNIDNFPTFVKSQISDVLSTIENHVSDLNSRTEELTTKVNQGILKLDNIISEVSEIKSICKSMKNDTDNIKNSVESNKKTITSALNVNRWILIVGFIVMVALNIVFKIL